MTRRIGEIVGFLALIAVAVLIAFTGEAYVARIIGAILIVHLLRELISAAGLFPPDSKLGRIFVNHAQRAAVMETLRVLGVDHARVSQKLRAAPPPAALSSDQLIALLTRRIAKFDQEIMYGQSTPVSSSFYINTMEASHDNNDLYLMVQLLNRLVLHFRDQTLPDFVLTPKAGNPFLAAGYQRLFGVPVMLRKATSDRSRARVLTGSEKLDLVNFEGSEAIKALMRNGHGPLRGIAIDCNTSGGTEIRESVEEFNLEIERLKWNVEKVTETFVLFRPDNRTNVDKLFEEKGLKIHRYFDLNENLKRKLFDVGPIYDPYAKDKQGWMLDFRSELNNNGGLVVNI